MSKPDTPIQHLFEGISSGSREAFNELFIRYYDRLVSFTAQYVRQPEIAEEITSELFVKIWLKRETITRILKPEVYLYVAAKNASLNHIRGAGKYTMASLSKELSTAPPCGWSDMENKELARKLDESVAALPEQRRIIFKLVREDGLKSKEVAAILNISVRTVENQMYKAIKTLADTVTDYLGYNPQNRISKKQLRSKLLLVFIFSWDK